jgi:hypothetical protein
MIGGDDDGIRAHRLDHRAVAEDRPRPPRRMSEEFERGPDPCKRDLPQHHDHAQVPQVRDLAHEKRQAPADLLRRRPVVRRRASTDGGDEGARQS